MMNQKSLTMKGEIIKPVFLTALIIREQNGLYKQRTSILYSE